MQPVTQPRCSCFQSFHVLYMYHVHTYIGVYVVERIYEHWPMDGL